MAGQPLEYGEEEAIRPASARMYFGRLDAAIAAELGADTPVEVPYLYVSLTVELRAIWTYRLYQSVLEKRPGALSLKSVLAEEELHLKQMLKRLRQLGADPEVRVPVFANTEDRLFRTLWSALDGACTVLPRAA